MQLLEIGVGILLKVIRKEQGLKDNKLDNTHTELIASHIMVLVLEIKAHQNFHHISQKQIAIFRNSLILQSKTNNTSAQIVIQLSLDHIRFCFSFFTFAPGMVINFTMCVTNSSIRIGSFLKDKTYCSRKGIKMSGIL